MQYAWPSGWHVDEQQMALSCWRETRVCVANRQAVSVQAKGIRVRVEVASSSEESRPTIMPLVVLHIGSFSYEGESQYVDLVMHLLTLIFAISAPLNPACTTTANQTFIAVSSWSHADLISSSLPVRTMRPGLGTAKSPYIATKVELSNIKLVSFEALFLAI